MKKFLFITGFCLVLGFLFYYLTEPTNYLATLYQPNHNFCLTKRFFGHNLNKIIFFCIFIFSTLHFLFNIITRHSVQSILDLFINSLLKVSLVASVILTLLLTGDLTHNLIRLQQKFSQLTINQKYENILSDLFLFTQFCLNHIDAPGSGRIITNFDPKEYVDPYIVNYFLYPKINLITPSDDQDYLIVYENTKTPLDHNSYKYIQFNEFSSIGIKSK